VAFECFSYKNLGYNDYKELGPGEITVITDQNCITLKKPGDKMKICTFLWVYYGYPASSYEGTSVEQMRYNCGAKMAERDSVKPDIVAGVPDSGIAHAVGYANASGIPFSRPFIKYTPTWPRSFMPTIQSQRNLIAKMKLLAVEDLIRGKSLLLIDDSIVRGTQLRETTEYLFESGAKEVHIRPACPPLVYGCKYLNFSRSSSSQDELLKDLRTAMLQTKFFRNTQIPILKNTSRWLMKSVKNSSSHPCVLTGLTICLIPAELTNANSVLIVGTVRNN
jgi:amidophosphoribosyltransferase